MTNFLKHILVIVCLLMSGVVAAQKANPAEMERDNKDLTSTQALEYEILYDEPDSLNKLFVTFHPLYAELFATNATFGFSGQLHYFYEKKWDAYLNGRKAYATSFDIAQAAGENRSTVDYRLQNYRFFEGGFTYHYKAETRMGTAKITPSRAGLNPRVVQSTVTTNLKVPALVRTIIGIRGGAYAWGSSVNLGTIAEEQGVNIIATTGSDTLRNDDNLFTNFSSEGFFVGGSFTQIRNIFIQPYGYDPVNNDHIFNLYLDILFSPFMRLETIEKDGTPYNVDVMAFNNVGARMGVQGMFNRGFGWTYNLELGLRPSLQQRTFYSLLRVGITLGSRLRLKRSGYVMH
ncbi:MAG: hypothetical protein ACFB0B_12940 [Thermonemataceae bacterium]